MTGDRRRRWRVGNPSTWFPPDAASRGKAVCLALGSCQGRWSQVFCYGLRRGGVNQDKPTTRQTEGAELGPPNSASGSQHHAEVGAKRNSCVGAAGKGAVRLAQNFNHSTRTTLHQSWERPSKQGMFLPPDRVALNLPTQERSRGSDKSPGALIARVRASGSETWSLVLCLRTYYIKEVLINGTKEEAGPQLSWISPKPCQHTLNSTPPGTDAFGRWVKILSTV